MKFLKGIALGLLGFLLFVDLPLLGLSLTANRTILNPDFIVAETAKLDIGSLASGIMRDLTPTQFQNYRGAIDSSMVKLKPWIDQQIQAATLAGFAYLDGSSPQFDVTFSTAPVKQSLSDNFTKAFLQSPPADYLASSTAQKNQYLARVQQQFVDSFPIPSTLEINSDTLGSSNLALLKTAKTIYGYTQNAFADLLVFTLILILLIVIVIRELKGVTRALGVIFMIDGVLTYAAFYVLQHSISSLINLSDFPTQVQTWVPLFINDAFSPGSIFSLAILVVGIILLASSFFFRTKMRGS